MGEPTSVPRPLRASFGALLLLAALAAVAAACSLGGGDAEPSTTPPPTTEATATATPNGAPPSTTPAADIVFLDARPVEIVEGRADLPADLALVVHRNGELWRIHRTPDGTLEERLLFDPFAYSSTRLITYWNISHLGPALPPGQLVIAACSTGECPALGAASEDALVSLFTSIDGGVSWTQGDELDGTALIATAAERSSLVLQRLAREDDSRTGRYEAWPSGQVIDPPTAAVTDSPPVMLDRLLTWWTAGGRLVDNEGNARLDLSAELSGGSVPRGIAALPNADASRLAVTLGGTRPRRSHRRLALVDLSAGARRPLRAARHPRRRRIDDPRRLARRHLAVAQRRSRLERPRRGASDQR